MPVLRRSRRQSLPKAVRASRLRVENLIVDGDLTAAAAFELSGKPEPTPRKGSVRKRKRRAAPARDGTSSKQAPAAVLEVRFVRAGASMDRDLVESTQASSVRWAIRLINDHYGPHRSPWYRHSSARAIGDEPGRSAAMVRIAAS